MSFLTILIAAWGAGSAILVRISLADALESLCFRLLAGLVPIAVLAVAVGSISLVWAQALVAGIAALSVVWSLRRRGSAHEPGPAWDFHGLNVLERGAIVALCGAWGLALISALAPVTGWDATVAHLALPSDYNREGRIFLHTGNVYSGYPHFMHALYAVAYFGGRELPVSLLNWAMGCLACLAVYCLGRRIGTRQTGLVAAALMATAPVFMDQAGSPGIDLPFAAYSTASLAAFSAWTQERKTGFLMLAGLLAGASCGIRHTGYLVCGLLFIAVVVLSLRARSARCMVLFGGLALISALPWLIRSWLVAGNPVFPFLLSAFPMSPIDHIVVAAPGIHESIERSEGVGLLAFFRFPWDIVMRPQLYDGWNKSPGGMILVLGVPGLILGGARAWWLGAFSVAGGTVFFFFQRLARYLLPFFTPMMVVAALAAERLPGGRRAVAGLLLFSFAYGLCLHAAAMHFKIPVVLGRQTKSEYLAARVERYGAFVFANSRLNDGGTLLTLDQRSYYVDGPTYQNHWSLKRIAELPLDAQMKWLHEHAIRYVMIPEDFVAESGALSGEIRAMLMLWQRSPRFFAPIDAPLALPRREGTGVEKVTFYAVQ